MIPNRRLERSERRVRTGFSLLVTVLSILSGVLGGLILVNTALSGVHHGRSGGTGLVPAAVKFGTSKVVACSALACSTTGYTVKAYSTLIIMFAASSSTAPSTPIVRHPKVTPTLVTDVANSPVENYVWYVPNITASTTVAVYSNFSASQVNGFMLADVQNVTTSPLACSGVGTGTSMTESASCSSTNPNTVSILVTGFEAATSPTQAAASGGDTALVALTSGPTSSQYVSDSSFYQVQSTSGSHTLSATTATSRTWAAIMFGLGVAAVPNAPTSFAHGTLTETTLPTTWSYSPTTQPIVNDTLKLASYSGGSCGTYGSTVSTGGRVKAYTYTGLTPGGAYCVEVFAWNSTGESSAATLTDVVLPANPSISFTVSPTSPDVGYAATFTSTVTGGVSPYTYAWTFGCGLGGTSTSANPSYTYTASGSCVVWVNVTDAASVKEGSHQTIVVNADPSVTWTVSPTSPDEGSAATFTSTVTHGASPYTYAWTFGCHLGGTSTAANPSYTYTASGSCVVWLNVTDADGVVAAYHQTITVNPTLTVSWTVAPTSPDQGSAATFTSTVSGGKTSYTYAWTFGCHLGGTSTAANPSYTYTTSGSCVVWLNVTDADSVTVAYHQTITVNPTLSVSWTVSPSSPDQGSAATFTSTVSGGKTPYTYAWTFGCHLGGTSTAANPSYTYTTSGSCVVWLNVTDADSITVGYHQTITINAPLSVSWSVSPTSPDQGSAATFTSTVSGGKTPYTYAWTFGCHLGGTSTSANPSYTYTASGSCVVWLNVTDADSVIVAYHQTIVVNAALSVSWTVSPTSPDQGSAATFTSTVSGGKTSYTYAWTFGCHLGGTSTAANPSYTYTTSGSCVVWLNVTDADSVTVAYHQTITVNPTLSVSWTVSPTSPDQGSAATFTSTVSGGKTPYTYAWTFGCHLGGTSTGANPSYTYTASGSCVVWLNVTDADSITKSYHQTITVNPTLTVSWSVSPTEPDVGHAATFTSVVSGGQTPYTYAWTFGCHLGGTSTSANPSYTYTTSGSCVVWLNVTDADSVIVGYHQTITVNAAPSVTWTAVPSAGEEGVSIAFTSHVSGGTSPFTYAWTFGCSSGGTSAAANPSYTYSVSGNCAVWVNVTDADGVVAMYHASYSVSTHLTIVSIGWSPTIPDVGSTTTFSSVVTGGVTPFGSSSYQWSLGGGVHQSGGPSFVPSRTYATAGTYVIWLNVTDAIGVVAMYHANLVVNNTPTASFVWVPTTPDVGVTTTFTSTVTPGAPPYTYAWAFGDHGGTSTAADPTHVFLHAGMWAVWLNVTDAQGEIATYHATITVVADPSVTWTAVPPAPDQGSPVVFTAHITGGTGPFTYAWSFGGGAGRSAAASPTATYGSFGTFQAWINVTDSEGEVASYHAFIDVNPTLTVSFVVSPPNPEVGIAAHFTSTVVGGQTPYAYAWTFGCGLGGTSTAASPHYTYPTAGSCVVWLNVTDADSVTVGYHLTVTIVQALGCSFTIGPRPIRVGTSELFTGTAFYGSAPYTYSWAFGDAATGSGQVISHAYLATGNYTVVLTVTDAGNVTASCSLPITVQAAQNNLGAPWAPWLVVAAIVAGFFVLFFIIAGRRRRKQPPHHHRPRPEMPAWSGGSQRESRATRHNY